MAEIRLYGKLRKQFASLYNLDIRSVGEAVRALCTVIPGFKKVFAEGDYVIKVGPMGRRFDVDVNEVHFQWGQSEIHIVPVPQGSKRNGIGKIIAGLALIAISFIPGAGVGGWGVLVNATENMAAITVASISQSLGVMMLMGGISRALAPRPKENKTDKDDSYLLNGPVATVNNQATVPVVYGLKVRAGMIIVSAGTKIEDINTSTNNPWYNDGIILPPYPIGGRYGTLNLPV